MGNSFSGSAQRRQYMSQDLAQREELNKQKAVAENEQVNALQSSLGRDTTRLLRVFGTRSLMSGGGLRAPVAGA